MNAPDPIAETAKRIAQVRVSVPDAARVLWDIPPTARMDEGLMMHDILNRAFQGNALRPWRLERVLNGVAEILGYSSDALAQRLQTAEPLVRSAVSLVASHPPTNLREGQTLRMATRFVPTVRQTGKGEVDALLYEVRKAPNARHDRAEVYRRYLTERLIGLEVLALEIRGFRLAQMRRRVSGKGGKKGWTARTFPVTDIAGLVRVVDPSKAEQTIISGVGRQRGFGYGFIRVEAA